MTLRELLKALNAVDEQHLDKEVLVSPHTGGYDSHPVINLAQPKPAGAPPDMWESQEGDVPAVNPADLRSVWKLFRDAEVRNPGQCGAISNSVYKGVCNPGADVMSVWYRASMLGMLTKMMPKLLAQWIHDGQPDDAVFQVAATFPMEKMKTGVPREGPPFDVEEFVKRIGART